MGCLWGVEPVAVSRGLLAEMEVTHAMQVSTPLIRKYIPEVNMRISVNSCL